MSINYLAILLFIVLSGCSADHSSQQQKQAYVQFQGETMGTYYRLTYSQAEEINYKEAIDSLLRIINLEVSTYIDHSTISRFNQADSTFSLNYNPETQQSGEYPNIHFLTNYKKSTEIFQRTEGYFDPTVMPLVNYWGFGYDEKRKVKSVDSILVDSLRQLIGMDKVAFDATNRQLSKAGRGVQLDFSAIAKGYAVDQIAQFINEEKGVQNYLVDIGGEVRARGVNAKGKKWKIGINVPKEDAALSEIQSAVTLDDEALATSGNYRNYYEVDGMKYSHTISPKSGFPERNMLLSASVFAPDCMTADAFATAFMVMGPERAFKMASSIPEIEAYFIIGNQDGGMDVKFTSGIAQQFQQTEQ